MSTTLLERASQSKYLHPSCLISYTCQPSVWVQLLELPHPDSDVEAMLLCQESDDRWVAWIPGYGEAVLYKNQFSEVS